MAIMTLVLLPGMDGTGALFEPFLAALGSRCNVKVVRYPTAEPMAYAELEAVAQAALPVEGPFVILGESFSGPIAISIAAACPSQLKGLILCCSFVRNPRPFFSGFKYFVGVLPVAIVPKAVLNYFLLGPFSTDALRLMLARAIAQVAPSVMRTRLRAVLTVNVSGKLSGLTVPVLYLRAAQDRVVPRAAAELVSKLNPRVRVVHLEAPHCLLQVAPVEAAQAIGAFVEAVQKAR